MTNNPLSDPDIVPPTLRGAVHSVVYKVPPARILHAWRRAGFFALPPGLEKLNDKNIHDYTSEQVFDAFSRNLNWKNQQDTVQGLEAYGIILRGARRSVQSDYFGYEDEFWDEWDELERTCGLLGFKLEEDGTLIQADTVNAEDLSLESLREQSGVLQAISRLNESHRKGLGDNEVIARCKNLVESVASAILFSNGATLKELKEMGFNPKVKAAHKAVGLDKGDPTYKVPQGMHQVISGLHSLIESLGELRNETEVGHGKVHAIAANPTGAKLAIDATRAWCRYVLELFEATDAANAPSGLDEPPF